MKSSLYFTLFLNKILENLFFILLLLVFKKFKRIKIESKASHKSNFFHLNLISLPFSCIKIHLCNFFLAFFRLYYNLNDSISYFKTLSCFLYQESVLFLAHSTSRINDCMLQFDIVPLKAQLFIEHRREQNIEVERTRSKVKANNLINSFSCFTP